MGNMGEVSICDQLHRFHHLALTRRHPTIILRPFEPSPNSTGQGSPVPAKPWRVPALDGRRSVLIVDASDETRVVLQTALERRGVRTMAASQAEQGLALARQHHPDLIVLDLEIDPHGLSEVAGSFAEQSRADRGSLVLLGSVRRQAPPYDGEDWHVEPLRARTRMISQHGLPGPSGN